MAAVKRRLYPGQRNESSTSGLPNSQRPLFKKKTNSWLTFSCIAGLRVTREITHLSSGASAPAALLGAGGAQRSLQGLGGDRLDVVAGRPDGTGLPAVERPCGSSLGLAAVGSLVAGLTWGLAGLCPRAGILSRGVSPRASGWSHPCPGPVLLPGGQRLHVLQVQHSQPNLVKYKNWTIYQKS